MKTKTKIELKRIRKAKKVTQEVLANALNVSGVTICRWEKGYCEPSISNIVRMCALLNVSADELLGIKEFNA